MKYNEVIPTASHSKTPSSSGRHPTVFSVPREMPLPIRKSVAVNPSRPSVKSDGVMCSSVRTYVFTTAAKIKNKINQGI